MRMSVEFCIIYNANRIIRPRPFDSAAAECHSQRRGRKLFSRDRRIFDVEKSRGPSLWRAL